MGIIADKLRESAELGYSGNGTRSTAYDGAYGTPEFQDFISQLQKQKQEKEEYEYDYRKIPYFGDLIGSAADATANYVAGAAEFLGADDTAKYLRNEAQKGQERLAQYHGENKTPELSMDYILSPNGLTRAAGSVGGSLLTSLAVGKMLTPASAVAGLTGLASKVPMVGNYAKTLASGAAQSVPATGFEAISQGGNWMLDQQEKGNMTPEQIQQGGRDVALENAGVLLGSNAIEMGLLGKYLGGLGKAIHGKRTGIKTATAIPEMAANLGLQSAEEGWQRGIDLKHEGKDYSYNPVDWFTDPKYSEQLAETKEGFAGLAPFSFLGVGGNYMSNRAVAKKYEGDEWESAFEEYKGKQMDNGKKGCVEAATKIGAKAGSPWLAKQLDDKVVDGDTLLQNAKNDGLEIIEFNPDEVERGDIILYDKNDGEVNSHTVLADGLGGVWGNSSSNLRVEEYDSYNMGDNLVPARIIKTGTYDGEFTDGEQGDFDTFVDRIGLNESGNNYDAVNSDSGASGKYQIMPENWGAWAEEAGLDANAEMTPENQEKVARHKLKQYYDKYGEAGALVAWYAGEANAERYANGEKTDIWGKEWTSPQGEYPSIQSYIDNTLGQNVKPKKKPARVNIDSDETVETDSKSSVPSLEEYMKMFDEGGTEQKSYSDYLAMIENASDEQVVANAKKELDNLSKNGDMENYSLFKELLDDGNVEELRNIAIEQASQGSGVVEQNDTPTETFDFFGMANQLRDMADNSTEEQREAITQALSSNAPLMMYHALDGVDTQRGESLSEEETNRMNEVLNSSAMPNNVKTELSGMFNDRNYDGVRQMLGTIPDSVRPQAETNPQAQTSVEDEKALWEQTQANLDRNTQSQQAQRIAQQQANRVYDNAPLSPQEVRAVNNVLNSADGVVSPAIKDELRKAFNGNDFAGVRKVISGMPDNLPTQAETNQRNMAEVQKAIDNARYNINRAMQEFEDFKNMLDPFEREFMEVLETVYGEYGRKFDSLLKSLRYYKGEAKKKIIKAQKEKNEQAVAEAQKEQEGYNYAIEGLEGIAVKAREYEARRETIGRKGTSNADEQSSGNIHQKAPSREVIELVKTYGTMLKDRLIDNNVPINEQAVDNALNSEKEDTVNNVVERMENIAEKNGVPTKDLKEQSDREQSEKELTLKEQLKAVKAEKEEILKPYLEYIEKTSGNGIEIVPSNDGSRRGLRVSKNAEWYQKWREANKSEVTPNPVLRSKKQKLEVAERMYRGEIEIDINSFRPKTKEEANEYKAEIQRMNTEMDTLNSVITELENQIADEKAKTEQAKAERKAQKEKNKSQKKGSEKKNTPKTAVSEQESREGVSSKSQRETPSDASESPTQGKSEGQNSKEEGKKVKANFSDKNGVFRGTIQDGIITIWSKEIPKKEFNFTVSLNEIEKALKQHGNSNYVIANLAKVKRLSAIENWINNTKDKQLRDKRRDSWENNLNAGKLSTANDRAVDSASNVIKQLYEKAIGHKPMTPFEKASDKETNTKLMADKDLQKKSELTQKEQLNLVKTEFPTAKKIKQNKDSISFKLFGHNVVVNFADHIVVSEAEKEAYRRDYGEEYTDDVEILGKTETIDGTQIITLLKSGEKDTISHEAFHLAFRTVLTKEQQDMLLAKYGDEEAVAEAYRKLMGKSNARGTMFDMSSKLGRLFQKIWNFANSLFNVLSKGSLLHDAESVMYAIADGSIYDINNGKKGIEAYIHPSLLAAWHGTPHLFDKFSTDFMGDGEGVQAHGWGLYFALDKSVANNYATKISLEKNIGLGVKTVIKYNGKLYEQGSKMPSELAGVITKILLHAPNGSLSQAKEWAKKNNAVVYEFLNNNPSFDLIQVVGDNQSFLYQVDIPSTDTMLREDDDFNKQPKMVQEAIKSAIEEVFPDVNNPIGKSYVVHEISRYHISNKAQELYDRKQETESTIEQFENELKWFKNGELSKREIVEKYDLALDKNEVDDAFVDDLELDFDALTRKFDEKEKNKKTLSQEDIDRVSDETVEEFLADRISSWQEELKEIENELKPYKYNDFNSWWKVVGHNLYGRKLYDMLARLSDSPKDASLKLLEKGVQGISYNGAEDGECCVVFNDKAVKILERNGEPVEENNTKLMAFAGKRATKVAPQNSLDTAMQMEKEGKSAEEIYKSTEWFKGKDNKWKYEIPDNLDSIDLSKLKDDKAVKLGDIYDNEKLFSAYPELKDIDVIVEDLEEKFYGLYTEEDNLMSLDEGYIKKEPNEIKKTILHEMQHAIQKIEGFAKGANSKFAMMEVNIEMDNVLKKLFGNKDNALGYIRKINQLKKALVNPEKNLATIKRLTHSKPLDEVKELVGRFDNLYEGIKKVAKLSSRKQNEAMYDMSAGEQESREVEARAEAKLNGEELSMPEPHKGDAVVVFGDAEIPIRASKSAISQIEEVRKQYEGTDKWMKAPNGKPTNLTERQWLQVRTPNFKKWFGDWENDPENASKVVDKNGEPLVVYHGTPLGGFEEFNRELNYFTADKEYADRYQEAGASSDYVKGYYEELGTPMTYPVFLNIREPFDTRNAKERKIFESEFYRKWGNGSPLSEKGLPDWTDSNDFREFFEENDYDYDGLLLDEGGVPTENGGVKSRGISYVAFEPNQIKSATDNSGEFSTNNNNIRLSARKKVIDKAKTTINNFLNNRNTELNERELTRRLEDLSGLKVKWGRVDSADKAILKTLEGVIRAKKRYDFESIVPLMGDAICKKLHLPTGDEAMNAYITQWLLTGESQPNTRIGMAFKKAMKQNAAYASQLIDVQLSFVQWNSLDADIRQARTIKDGTEKGTRKDKAKSFFEKIHDQFIEELGPVKRMVDEIEKVKGEKLKITLNPYIAFRMFRGHYGKAMVMVEGKTNKAVNALKTLFPSADVHWENFKTLQMIFDEVGVTTAQDIKEFAVYCAAKHFKDINVRNTENEQKINSAKAVLEKAKDKEYAKSHKDEVEKARNTLNAFKDWQPYTVPSSFTEADCDKTISKYQNNAKFVQGQKDVVNYSKTLVDICYSAGLMSEERYNQMRNSWENYVPLHRSFAENENIWGDSFKHMTGSAENITNPFETLIHNTFEFMKQAEKNKAKRLLADVASMSDLGAIIENVPEGSAMGNTIRYYVDGKIRYLEAEPQVVNAINNMGMSAVSWYAKFFKTISSVARACFTSLNPSFVIRNALRDVQDAAVYNKGLTPYDFFYGFKEAIKHGFATLGKGSDSEKYYEWLASGAAQASAVALDRNYSVATMKKITKTWDLTNFGDFWSAMLNYLQAFSEYSEYGTRIGVYEGTKRNVKKNNKNATNAAAILEAAYMSRDQMDFARGGKASRDWNNWAIFANASIQGWDKFYRALKDNPRSVLTKISMACMCTYALSLMFDYDDEWYKELPDFQKQNFWIMKFGDTIWRIPKGQDVGLRFFTNAVDKMIGVTTRGEKANAESYFKPVQDLLPSILPTALLPAIEAMTNYSIFREAPIVPGYQQRLPEYMQYSPNSSGVAKGIASLSRFFGFETGISPRKIDHLIYGYGGSVVTGLAQLGGLLYDGAMGDGVQIDYTNITKYPILSGITAEIMKNPNSVTEFYKEYDKQNRFNAEYKQTKKKPDGYDPALYKRMDRANKLLSKYNKQEREILMDKKLTPEAKNAKLKVLSEKRVSVVKKVMKK